MQPIFEERRATDRARVIFGGTVVFNQRQSTLDCIVQNFSEAGARIVLDEVVQLPDHVDLLINRKGRTYNASVVWRGAREAGVSFLPSMDENAPVPLDWVRRLRNCETEKRALQAQLDQLVARS